MTAFLDQDFLLGSEAARRLYHDHARDLPIIDYHCHLSPGQIAADTNFENLTQAWLSEDHYKWRAMRINGVAEHFCTGEASDRDKFGAWAATVPYTLRNPIYHWTHLELQRYFGISKLLTPGTAGDIYDECSEKLRSPEYSVRGLMKMMRVELVCTTDDPLDQLESHRRLRASGAEVRMLPAFRPDKAMDLSDPAAFNEYGKKLELVTGMATGTLDEYLAALRSRHDHFAANGCVLSDHGLEFFPDASLSEGEAAALYARVRNGEMLGKQEQDQLRGHLLKTFATWDWEKGWVQQFHFGVIRNNNSRLMAKLGADTGFDSMSDVPQASRLAAFLDVLDREDRLARTILYNLNPADNEMLATMAGNFSDGSVTAKVQWGSAWWFMDQQDGMTRQLNGFSNLSLISRFVGMLTDSRSFLSFPRHEYFRRILCNLFGAEITRGELPADFDWIGQVISDICYHNSKNFFKWER